MNPHRKRRWPTLLVTVGILGGAACREDAPPPPVPVSVLATASLEKFALDAAAAFEEQANVVVDVRTGGTYEIAAELASTRSADLFFSASLEWMDRLAEQGLIVGESRWEAMGNRMVILGRQEAEYPSVPFVELATLGFRRFVVPDPSRDPAGRYARRWLGGVGTRGRSVWLEVEDRRETVDSIAEVVEAVADDPSAVGVVFITDIAKVPSSVVLHRSHDVGIQYSFALVDRDTRPPEAQAFLEFLRSSSGLELVKANGLLIER